MALLYDSRWRSTDSNGAPYSGATLTIYTATTTTLASVYSDAALATPLTNPVTADSAGRFPQIYAADGSLFDILEKTSAGVLITSYEDVSTLGSDSGSFTRDLITARFAARADGSTIRVEAGDPSPDNTGGTMELGGWNGTQADSVTLDGAIVDTTGTLKEKGKGLIGVVNTAATPFAAATSVDIALPTTSRACIVELFDLVCTDDGNLRVAISYDNGATYKSGASDYASIVLTSGNGAAAATNAGAGSTMDISVGFATPTSVPGRARIEIVTPTSGSNATLLRGTCEAWSAIAAGKPEQHQFSGFGLGGYGRATHIRVSKTLGTIAGKYMASALYGYE